MEKTLFEEYLEAAEQGDSEAQFQLALCYEKSEGGVIENETKAVHWYRKAAEQGHTSAQTILTGYYFFGWKKIVEDKTKAINWYIEAENDSGLIPIFRKAVYNNRAIDWLKKMAEQGNGSAQHCLAQFYLNGYGVARDDAQAIYWFQKADKREGVIYGWGNAEVRYNLAKIYWEKGEIEDALIQCIESINRITKPTEFNYDVYVLRGDIYVHKGEYENAHEDYIAANRATKIETRRRDLQKKLDEVEKILQNKFDENGKIYQKQLEEYTQSFLKQSYHKRKLMVPVDKVYNPPQRTLSVLDINNLPKGICFLPGGYPVNNRLYIGHPYIVNTYIPFQDYELEFVDEKLREFCYLMQCIGATEVTIESINGKSKSNYLKKSKSGSESSEFQGKGKTPMTSGSVDVEKTTNYYGENESSMDENLTRFFAQSQTFKPKDFPYIPEKLVWYPNEPSWIRLVEQRMQGSLLEHREKIETKKSRMVEQTDISQIQEELNIAVEASVKLFSGSGKLDTSNSTNTENKIKLGLTEDVELSIYVKFAPIDTFRNDNSVVDAIESKSIAPSTYSKEELEYLDELKSCLSESNEILPKGRRLLAKIRDTLGISEERAIEIENSLLIPQFTEKEKEYIEELKTCFGEDNEISEKERRLLNKVRIGLNTSEERASEIEAFIINK